MKSTPKPFVSIIIPTRKNNDYLHENLRACLSGLYKNFEILILSDRTFPCNYPKTRVIKTGSVGPAIKRDLGAKLAKGKILAFLDDDAYPTKHWLSSIVSVFENKPKIAAVGGPGITPPNVSWQEEASGWVSASWLGAGHFIYRFLEGKRQNVDDYPSMNLSVRKVDFLAVGGFDSTYYPGEDTKLCLDLTHTLHKKIQYEPKAVVYHHRRPLWAGHLKQQGNYGLHRGHFARILPQTSARPIYFLPSGLVLLSILFLSESLLLSIISVSNWMLIIWFNMVGILGIYLVLLIVNATWVAYHSYSVFQGIISIPAVFLTHIWYGYRFLYGYLVVKNLET